MSVSYAPIGIARARSVPGFQIDETTATVGHGDEDFARACAELKAWRHVQLGWLEVFPPAASIDPGTTVALLARHFSFWSLNALRVVYGLEESTGAYSSLGFAYGTLADHVERGEELFEVRLDRLTGAVTYRIRAASQPRVLLARIGQPAARALQARFRQASCDSLRAAIASS